MATDVNVPEIGKYTFESLTKGMYSNPLDSIREYVQNSIDAIEHAGTTATGRIDLDVNPIAASITVRDNGPGIASTEAVATLQNVGLSSKPGEARGFRGIGRLGGLAFCDEVTFRTKAAGKAIVTELVWDCALLRDLLRRDNSRELGMAELIAEISDEQMTSVDPNDPAFFEVEMQQVREPLLLDVVELKRHLRAVAPIAFDAASFHFASEIDVFLSQRVPDYLCVDLLVNDEMLFKPFTDSPLLSRAPGRSRGQVADRIKSINFLTLTDGSDDPLAHGWVAQTDLKGMLEPQSGIAGIRLRSGNIAVGDGKALEECFPLSDARFAQWLLGEIHCVAPGLVPNARRDGFEHGQIRNSLIDAFARQVAEPYRKRIREASKGRAIQKRVGEAQSLRTDAEALVRRGVQTEDERQQCLERIDESRASISELGPGVDQVAEELKDTAEAVQNAPRFVDVELAHEYRRVWRDRFQELFEIVYNEADDKEWALRTISKMTKYLKTACDGSEKDQ